MSLILSYLLSISAFLLLKSLFSLKKCMTELMKSTNTSTTNLIRRDLARVRKIC